MVDQRRKLRPNIKQTLGERLVLAGHNPGRPDASGFRIRLTLCRSIISECD